MSEARKKTKLSALLMASLITANFVCAADAYRNNVVDVKVSGEAGNAVKVTIYTDKPYTEPVVVNKKANNKYVILMPETNSSLKGAPTVTNGSGTISNVTVNTQAVTGGKGYTKIIITSEKAINVVPRTQQMTAKTVSKPATSTTTVLNPNAPVNTKTLKQDTPKKVAQAKKQESKTTKASQPAKPAVKPKPTTQKLAQAPVKTVAPKKEPIEVLEQEIKTDNNAPVEKNKNDEILNNEIQENLAGKPVDTHPELDTQPDKKTVLQNIKAALKDYQNISLWKLLLLAGAVTFPIIVIMIILTLDKKINKKIDKSFRKREEEEGVDYSPSEFQTESQTTNASTQTLYSDFELNQPQITNEELISGFNQATQSAEDTSFNNDFSDEDFEHDFSENLTEAAENINTEPEVQQPEFVYNNDLVEPEPVDETTEPQQLAEPVAQNTEPYNPDGFLSDFAGVNDKDFFDELALRTMAANNADGLPEESPADEIFNFMSEDEPTTTYNKVTDELTDSISEVKNQTTPIQKETPTCQNETVNTDGDDLTMLTEVKINDSTGMYLVNYENFSSLVGHINDDYFVIKKFDDMVSGKIILKQAEKLKDSTRYLVRVGKNKMVVEVSDTSMNRLLDL